MSEIAAGLSRETGRQGNRRTKVAESVGNRIVRLAEAVKLPHAGRIIVRMLRFLVSFHLGNI